MEITKPHAVLLASPGLGHLVPMLELGSRLSLHNFHVTVLVAATTSFPTRSQLTELSPPPNILSVVKLSPPVDISGILEPGAAVLTKIVVMMRRTLPSLRSALSAMTIPPTALFVDFFGTEALEIASELNLRKYVFVPCSAWFVAQTVHVPTLHGVGELINGEKEPLRLPGCKPIRRDAAFEPLRDRESRTFGEYVQIGAAMSAADGILVNSWEDLESVTLDALREDAIWGRLSKVPVHAIGPVVRSSGLSGSGTTSEISDWLDRQPNGSVVFVSFGSGGALSGRQIAELAWGMELSRQRFVWVVRPPSEDDSSATFFTVGTAGADGTPTYLPKGFCERTRGVGLLIQMWGPQEEILSHAAVGGFLSHCGWNSTVESIVNGVPMIAWPLYAEQSMNAALLTEELGVAVRPAAGEDGVVGRAEIGRIVRTIIEGKEEQAVRLQRVGELKRGSIEALSKGGSSHTSLARLADECHKCMRACHASSAN